MGDKEDSNEKESKHRILIDNANLLSGVYSCLHNSEKFVKASKLLFDNENYQASIPIATISIEESMKGLALLRKFSSDQVVTIKDWMDLKNHKHKLTYELEWAIKHLGNASDSDLEKAKEAAVKIGYQSHDISADRAIRELQNKSGIYAHFQKLRESCFYSDWDKLRKKWTIFDELLKEKQEALSFFIYKAAQSDIDFLKKGIEAYVNRLRETGQLLEKLPYPSYEEFRPPEKWESRGLTYQIQRKADRLKFEKGAKVMKQFIKLQSFQLLSFNIFRKIIDEYSKVVAKQENEKRFPHPMIKAMLAAISIAREKSKDGENISMLSGDAEQTHSGNPRIMFTVAARMKSGVYELVRITDMAHPKIEFTQDMIEKIIQTEIIIERNQGKEIPSNIWIEALSVIGIRTKMIKLAEIPEAIRLAKKMTQSRQWKRVSEETICQINAIKGTEEWNGLSGILRSMIVTAYGQKKYPGYNIYLTPNGRIQKFKCREIILMVLEKPYIPTA